MTSKSSRNFILTLNEKTLEHYNNVLNYLTRLKGMRYILVTEHFGQENKHYHCYVQYDSSKRLSMEKLHGAHLEKCYGSAQSNIDYCRALDDKHKKLGVTAKDIYEEGEPRFHGGILMPVKNALLINDKQDLPELRMYHLWRSVKNSQESDPINIRDWRKDITVYWIQGPSGIGKTEKAKQIVLDNEEKYGSDIEEVKFVNNFWLNAKGKAPIAIYDDFRDSHMKPSEFINFIDYNTHNLNVKGGHIKNKYNLIIITSIQRLSEIYSKVSEEPRKQWERRIEVIDMYPQKILTTSNGQLNSRDYVEDNECYYCDQNIDCKCKCIENNKKCNEKQCNLDKFSIEYII